MRKLVVDLLGLARQQKVYWIVPLVLLVLLLGLAIVAAQGALPYVYTLF